LGLFAAAAATMLAHLGQAGAVIKVDLPVSKMVDTAGAVVVGAVSNVSASNRVVDVKVVETVKGDSPGELLRFQLLEPAAMIEQVKAGASAVVFIARGRGDRPAPATLQPATLHLADTWLLAMPIPSAKSPAWRVEQVYQGKQSFPGRTTALAQALRDAKAGKSGLLDKVEHKAFSGGFRQLAKLDVQNADFLLAADVNGDKKPDLLVNSPTGGARVFLAGADGKYREAAKAWCPFGAVGPYAAFGDVNGDSKPDFLQNGTIWLNTGAGFAATKATMETPPKVRPLAAALADVNADGRADAILLAASGELRVYENPGHTDGPWKALPARTIWTGGQPPAAATIGDFGDDSRPYILAVWPGRVVRYGIAADSPASAEYEQMTGEPLTKYHKSYKDGMKNILATPIDINGDGRRDLFILADGGGLMMVNRGYGAFLVDPAAGGEVLSGDVGGGDRRKLPFTLTPRTPWTPADVDGDKCEDLLILTPEGVLYQVSNPPTTGP
jgi:hypothetical protein